MESNKKPQTVVDSHIHLISEKETGHVIDAFDDLCRRFKLP